MEPQDQSKDTTETLTIRTEFADGRISATLDTVDGPPTWVKIFSSIQSAARFAEVYNLELVDNVSSHNKSEEC